MNNSIIEAIQFTQESCNGRLRASGEPLYTHPVEVLSIATRIIPCTYQATETWQAAICHDLLEDTGVEARRLIAEFGAKVIRLVESLTKTKNRKQTQHKILAGYRDNPAVLYLKLADRLHNMRTLHYLPQASRVRIAQETLEFYVPWAHKLKLDSIGLELHRLALHHLL
jgi:GTP pyrophosphokinase